MDLRSVTFKYTLINIHNQQTTLSFTHLLPASLNFATPSPQLRSTISSFYTTHHLAIEQHIRRTCVRCNAPATISQNNPNGVAYNLWRIDNASSANPEVRHFIWTACGVTCQAEVALRLNRSMTLDEAIHRAAAIMVFPSVE
ncbi:MAG: hypothetical protein HETSPECPRED_010253 [Heterodermia speciosa]|uniref:Uncharacterized protein n=1 Tax=Heterodermia speciosa TaxID=116794 RepID=A0A8H3EY57_9LECA|nr:MAG: hypothetical protein HETSPECPRED_010253 [Heterodermia speciosa]